MHTFPNGSHLPHCTDRHRHSSEPGHILYSINARHFWRGGGRFPSLQFFCHIHAAPGPAGLIYLRRWLMFILGEQLGWLLPARHSPLTPLLLLVWPTLWEWWVICVEIVIYWGFRLFYHLIYGGATNNGWKDAAYPCDISSPNGLL